ASESTKKLKEFCKEHDGSLFMALISIWRVLIYKYTSQKDVIIGTPIAGRNHIDVENQLGCFINTLALRQTIDPLESFYILFGNTKTEILEAFTNQDFPFDKLVEELRIPREISRNPLFDVMLTMQNNEEIGVNDETTAIDLDIVDEGKMTAKLDLDINFQEVGDYLSFNIIYNTDVYHKNLIQSLMVHFKALLIQVLDAPGQAIGKSNLLSEKEKDELVKKLNNSQPKYTLGENIVEVFQRFVKDTPEKRALLTRNGHYTYEEIDRLSNCLANFILRKKEVLKGDFVGVLLPRDEWLLISMVTTFKLGAVYIPIDVDYPEERIEHILNNSECSFVIDSNFINKFEENQHTIPTQFLNRLSSEDEVAYVMHTSGSTGKPKAAMITHEGMMNHLRIMEQELELDTESIVVQNATATFDISIWQLINALITGGSTSIYDTNTIFDPSSFLERIALEKASVLQVVPGYLTLLLNQEEVEQIKRLSGLKYLLVTGEVVQKSLIEAWFKQYPNVAVVNAYGPAEAADDVALHIMKEVPETPQVPIGHTVSNMAIYIVDEHEQLCPKGVVGEIWVAGIGVGKGYYNDLQKTKENFRNNPFDNSRPKLYKTGDLGYWSELGELQFIGRKDNQVKVRGYRIELGEIEYALAKNERLKEVVVITKKDHENKNILVAYYTATEDISNEEIKNQLKLSIPSYMIPGIITKLNKLPVTPNGKVDRKALTLLANDENTSKKVFEAPNNEIEKQLVEIWKEVLKIDAISINDNFFEIGGDSLSIIKVTFKIKEKLLMDISIISLFEFSDIVSLGAYIEYLNQETSDEENYEVLNI
ncbi:amino acid adenylation domain-containing protein, partial [Flavobacteriaceae bacterium]|nr:amino acid adenylation domain-containing protein [Flavobacteriaceae bacterium]